MTNYLCSTCRSPDLDSLPQYRELPRVTSDCKPWPSGGELAVCLRCGTIQKVPTPEWFDEIGRIYANYEIYNLSDGAEQAVFSPDGVALPRSQILARIFAQYLPADRSGHLLDIGCGNGSALASFHSVLPGWSLSGTELSDKALSRMRSIPGFARLYTCPTDEIDETFDAVSMIHSLEHMPDPGQALIEASNLMTSEAHLLIEVPDAETSPFDLLIADHLTHFTRDGLRYLASRAGIAVEYLDNTLLPKENTMIGMRATPTQPVMPSHAGGQALARRTLDWLVATLETAREASQAEQFGVFGSSISAVWLSGALGDAVSFFVDEDSSRIGRNLHGKPILAPANAPADSTIFLPLAPQIAPRVAERLSHLPVRFAFPPLLGSPGA